MPEYFDKGDTAGGSKQGYFDRDVTQTGPAEATSTGDAPIWSAKDDIELDPDNPNIVRAAPDLDETTGVTSPQHAEGTYPDIIEGSDSERTGTSWGLPAVEGAPTVETPGGKMAEGEGQGEAAPTRNVGDRTQGDPLAGVGGWSTIDPEERQSAGSPTGQS